MKSFKITYLCPVSQDKLKSYVKAHDRSNAQMVARQCTDGEILAIREIGA
jgi:hypothetical protein